MSDLTNQVSLSRSFAFKDLPSQVREHAAAMPGAPAVQCEDRRVDWAAFDRLVDGVAAALQDLGVGPGDKVAMLARPSVDYVAAFVGALRAGACAVPLSNMASGETLARMINDSDARMLIIDRSMRDLIEPVRAGLAAIDPRGLIGFDFEGEGWRDFAAWIAAPGRAPRPVTIDPSDDFNIIYSSGTTGVPKGIVHSHLMRATTCEGMRPLGFGPDCVTLLSTPLYSNTTLVTLLPTLAFGGLSVLMPKSDVEKFLDLSARVRATHTMLVPVQYERILAHPAYGSADLSSYRMKLSTSAPLRAPIKRRILDTWPGGLVEFYGLTEGGASCTLVAHEFPDKLHTVGRPAPGAEIRIIDEAGVELPPGEVGEIVGRSALMMKGYHKRPSETSAMHWFAPDGTLFFRSGDMGRLDADGFLTLLDRKKDMIISGGFNIYAADLEAVLARHPAVDDVAVIGVPSVEWGETPLALVVPVAGAAVTPEDLRAWANERLGKTQRISAVEFRDSLPRSTIGKVLKRELREPYLAKAG